MTREEAIEWFKNSPFYHKEHEPFKMAIEALEQNEQASEWYKTFVEKFDSCDDAISRKSVLEWIQQSLSQCGNTYTTDMLNMWGLFEEQIKTFPSVNPKSDVLDKIQAEILNKAYRNFDEHINDYTDEVIDLDDALEIIGKYRKGDKE